MRDVIYIILVVLLTALFVWLYIGKSRDAQRWEDNFYANSNTNSNTKVLTKSEMRKYLETFEDSLLDTLNKMMNFRVKAKNINNITNVEHTYINKDTTIIKLSDTNEYDISYMTKDECWGFDGRFSLGDTTFRINQHFFNNMIRIIEFNKRRNLWNWKPMPRWGKREYYRKTIDDCEGSSTVEKIMKD